ncbi:hypothetical protein CL647_00505 [bacterium]|nr:hypothetical protein [bacterium]
MIASVIIWMLVWITNILALEELETTFTLSDKTEINTYSNFIVLSSPEKIKLYQDKLNFKWEISNKNHHYHKFQFEFNKAYALNIENQLHQINLTLGTVENLGLIKGIDSYEVSFPYIWAKTTQNKVYVYDLRKEKTLWDASIACNKMFFLSGNELIGCIKNKNLIIYKSFTGELFYKTKTINGKWDFEKSNSLGGYFSKGNRISYFDASEKKLINNNFQKETIKGFIREKEILMVDKESKDVICVDFLSEKTRWKYKFKTNLDSIQNHANTILIKDTENYKIIDNFSGEKIAEFKMNDSDLKIKTIYSYDNQYYIITNHKTYLVNKD